MQKGGNPGCGDVVTMYLKVDEDGRITDISFEGEGCTISQAAASMVTEMFEGRRLEEVEATPPDADLDLLGREIVSHTAEVRHPGAQDDQGSRAQFCAHSRPAGSGRRESRRASDGNKPDARCNRHD